MDLFTLIDLADNEQDDNIVYFMTMNISLFIIMIFGGIGLLALLIYAIGVIVYLIKNNMGNFWWTLKNMSKLLMLTNIGIVVFVFSAVRNVNSLVKFDGIQNGGFIDLAKILPTLWIPLILSIACLVITKTIGKKYYLEFSKKELKKRQNAEKKLAKQQAKSQA